MQGSTARLLKTIEFKFPLNSEDGSVILNDTRTSEVSGKIINTTEFTDVKYHPQIDNLFLTCDNRGNLCLRDARMAFSSPSSYSGGVVMKVS